MIRFLTHQLDFCVPREISTRNNSEKVEAATAPFQYALKTKAGCERRSRLSDPDRNDNHVYRRGRGARSISRNAMLEGFLRRSDLPFVRMFYGKTRWGSLRAL